MVANRADRRAGRWVLLACLLAGADARAQSPSRGIEFEDLGLTRAQAVSVRGAGLPAFVPPAADATALIHNPAGLCRIKPRSGQLAFSYDSQEIVTEYDARSTGLSSNRAGLLFAGAAFPIPVLRGSLVPAVAVHRMFTSDLDIAYEYENTADLRTDAFRLEQSGSTYAFALGFGVNLASVLSAGLSMSVFEGGYDALRQSHTRDESVAVPVDRYVIDDINADLDGVVARVGVMLFAHRHVHIAINVTTPTLLNQSVDETSEITEVVENGTGSTVTTESTTSTEYVVPYRIDGGVEIPWGDWLLSLQAGTCDWSEAAIDNGRLRLQNGNAVLGRTLDLSAGVEWTSPFWPLRLRAGAARLPFALEYVQADRIDNDQLEEVASETAPLRFSFGAGVALKHTILIDAVFTHTTGDRRAATFSEDRTWSQIAIEGSYWF